MNPPQLKVTLYFSILLSIFSIPSAYAEDDTLYQSLNHINFDYSVQNYDSSNATAPFLPSTSSSNGFNISGQYFLLDHILITGSYYSDLFGDTTYGKLDYNYSVGGKLFYQYSPGSIAYIEMKTGQLSISQGISSSVQTRQEDYNTYTLGIDTPLLTFGLKQYQFSGIDFQTIIYDMRLNMAKNESSSWLGYTTGQGGSGMGLTFGLEYPLGDEGISEGHIGLSYAF